jgi:hypothetical protein
VVNAPDIRLALDTEHGWPPAAQGATHHVSPASPLRRSGELDLGLPPHSLTRYQDMNSDATGLVTVRRSRLPRGLVGTATPARAEADRGCGVGVYPTLTSGSAPAMRQIRVGIIVK